MTTDLTIDYCTDREQWENFVLSRPEANFLQSFSWGAFQETLGKKVYRLLVMEQGVPTAGSLVVVERAKRGTHLTAAGGPLLTDPQVDLGRAHQQLQLLNATLKQIAHQEQALFVRIRPQLTATPAVLRLLDQNGWQPAPMHLTADLTLQLDLTKSEEELMAQMRKNTRYDIRRAQKLGITVRQSTNTADMAEFYRHQLELAHKQNFIPFSQTFLTNQFTEFASHNQAVLFHAYQDQVLLASAFVIFYNQEAVYHYGISTAANAKLPGSYACQWAAIKTAKARGCNRYNFWGIAPEDQPQHRFAGVSLFKRGFGGQEIQYAPAHDLATSRLYPLVALFENWRKHKRGL